MTNLKTKLTVGLSTAALLATSFAPAAFADTIRIRGNGNGSTNNAKIVNKKKLKVKQSNWSFVVNSTSVKQNTGKNDANQNTGGEVSINTGDTNATVRNTTHTGGNEATLSNCGCCENGDDTIVIRGNGNNSDNDAKIKNSCKTKISQSNGSIVVNHTSVVQNTGGNDANKNTGDGESEVVDMDTGDATSTVTNSTTTGGNSLTIN